MYFRCVSILSFYTPSSIQSSHPPPFCRWGGGLCSLCVSQPSFYYFNFLVSLSDCRALVREVEWYYGHRVYWRAGHPPACWAPTSRALTVKLVNYVGMHTVNFNLLLICFNNAVIYVNYVDLLSTQSSVRPG